MIPSGAATLMKRPKPPLSLSHSLRVLEKRSTIRPCSIELKNSPTDTLPSGITPSTSEGVKYTATPSRRSVEVS